MRARDLFRDLYPCVIVLSVFLGLSQSAIAAGDCGFKKGDPKAGEAVYNETCIACHGEDGKGAIPGTPDFNKKGGSVLSKSHAVLMNHIRNGFEKPGDPMAMPAKGGNPRLSDTDLMNVHAYLHFRFGCG